MLSLVGCSNNVYNWEFEYSYENNNTAGTATITITGKGNYTGSQSKEFKIRGDLLEKPTLVQDSYTYDGTNHSVEFINYNQDGMEVLSGSVTNATKAGTYKITIKLKTYYTWNDGTRDDVVLEWMVEKADVTLTASQTDINIRVGESINNIISVETSGNINGKNLTCSTQSGSEDMSMETTTIDNNKSTVTIEINSNYATSDIITIRYEGDENHKAGEVTVNVVIIPIYVNFVINGNGSARVNGCIAETKDGKYEVAIGSGITFTATPEENYGLIKYSIQNNLTYMAKTSTIDLTGSFTSATITVSDTLLGNNGYDVTNNLITIELWFDQVIVVTLDTDKTSTGAITTDDDDISTIYEGKEVNFRYNSETKSLTVFESSQITVHVKAEKIAEQYYAINKYWINDSDTDVRVTEFDIKTNAADLIQIQVQAVKVFNAETRDVKDGSIDVGSISVTYNDWVTIDGSAYVIEGTPVNIVIQRDNDNYDLLGIKVAGVVTLKSQFVGKWEHTTNSSTWKAQPYSKELSEMEAIMLEKWCPADEVERKVQVRVVNGVDARLVNTSIGYSYTLADNIFDVAGSVNEWLYAGNWKIVVESANITNYQVKVTVVTNSGEQIFGKDTTFRIDSEVTQVIIEITNV